MNWLRSNLVKLTNPTSPVITLVRYFEKKKYVRRYGYDDPLFKRPDTLPRIKGDKTPIPMLPKYNPKNPWSEKRALYGQNDYIDILGDGTIEPWKLLKDIPPYLRGFKGNEYQMLLRKKSYHFHWKWTKPTKYKWMHKRIMFLYKYLNRKTRTFTYNK